MFAVLLMVFPAVKSVTRSFTRAAAALTLSGQPDASTGLEGQCQREASQSWEVPAGPLLGRSHPMAGSQGPLPAKKCAHSPIVSRLILTSPLSYPHILILTPVLMLTTPFITPLPLPEPQIQLKIPGPSPTVF